MRRPIVRYDEFKRREVMGIPILYLEKGKEVLIFARKLLERLDLNWKSQRAKLRGKKARKGLEHLTEEYIVIEPRKEGKQIVPRRHVLAAPEAVAYVLRTSSSLKERRGNWIERFVKELLSSFEEGFSEGENYVETSHEASLEELLGESLQEEEKEEGGGREEIKEGSEALWAVAVYPSAKITTPLSKVRYIWSRDLGVLSGGYIFLDGRHLYLGVFNDRDAALFPIGPASMPPHVRGFNAYKMSLEQCRRLLSAEDKRMRIFIYDNRAEIELGKERIPLELLGGWTASRIWEWLHFPRSYSEMPIEIHLSANEAHQLEKRLKWEEDVVAIVCHGQSVFYQSEGREWGGYGKVSRNDAGTLALWLEAERFRDALISFPEGTSLAIYMKSPTHPIIIAPKEETRKKGFRHLMPWLSMK